MTLSTGAGDIAAVPADLDAAAREFDPNTRNTDGRLWERTAELRRTCPVFHSEQMDGFTAVVDHGLVTEAMRDWRTYSSADGALLRQAARDFRLYPFELDPPLHTSIKGCLSPLFTKARVRALEPEIREIVTALIDAFAGRGTCEFMSEFAFPLSGRVVYERLLGGPPEDQERVFGWVSEFILRPDGPEALTALAALRDWTVEVLERPGADRRPEVVQALLDLRVDGRPLSADERAMTNVLLVLAAFESTALAVGNIFLHLLRQPGLVARMQAQPECVDTAIEELLRVGGSVPGVKRTVTTATSLGGHPLDAGEVVYLVVQGANVDPNAFEDPDEVDLDRRARGAPAHLSFGAGIHQCLGRNVARLEIKVAIEEVFARLPGLRLVDEHVVFGQGQNWGPTALTLTWDTP
jgi:cytochrome P450